MSVYCQPLSCYSSSLHYLPTPPSDLYFGPVRARTVHLQLLLPPRWLTTPTTLQWGGGVVNHAERSEARGGERPNVHIQGNRARDRAPVSTVG